MLSSSITSISIPLLSHQKYKSSVLPANILLFKSSDKIMIHAICILDYSNYILNVYENLYAVVF